ncbi:hypothetical protein RII68_002188 [Vibrio parahaemolyticus]|nr:hypothetical protein [Vibrio parahaemolyticus]EGQ7740034.1 hypothetical protein [Vibrio parahaemolyticus]EIO3964912.1 hypothetical protein [Vibrio parahaemolyticus]EIO3987693.1 hypothetical protein [Vibrio parahaemolyticus]EJG1396694.1 hypothetical protein [Vibrio parahaemolyticus]ELA9840637.1 hypothetical protein [Vibrio parahaemolyticus]
MANEDVLQDWVDAGFTDITLEQALEFDDELCNLIIKTDEELSELDIL